MSSIQFERRKKKKLFFLPLVVLLLLYVAIPSILISKGSKLMEAAQAKITEKSVYAPTTEFFNGLTFLETAASFPGFGFWANNVRNSSVKKLLKYKDIKLKEFVVKNLKPEVKSLENVKIIGKNAENKAVLQIISNDSIQSELSLSDSLLMKIDSIYCKTWLKFIKKTNTDKSQINDICKE